MNPIRTNNLYISNQLHRWLKWLVELDPECKETADSKAEAMLREALLHKYPGIEKLEHHYWIARNKLDSETVSKLKEQVANQAADGHCGRVTEMTDKTKAIMAEHGENKNACSLSLIAFLDASVVPHDVFANYLNVNGIDRKLGFDASAGPIMDWASDICLKLCNDKEMMARVVKRFGKKG